MKVTYNWLKELTGITASPEEVAQKLTSAGMEVEEIIYQNKHLHDVVVGKIIKIEKHPQADRLLVCQVDIGKEIVQIITSATNIFEGALVPVSLPGADLVNGVKIQKSKMRGVESVGMFCSGEELGIDENYIEGAGVYGILILPKSAKVGRLVEEELLLNDVIFDIGITPNRADCMSVIGIAREICALYGTQLKKINLNYDIDVYAKDSVRDYVNVEVKTKNCYRYMAAAITDIKIEKSPLWLRARLNAVGIKPINTLVDITNYVLIELGQPLHAFDQSFINGKQIIVRQANKSESIEVLNHNTYNLDENIMVIADSEKPMVIAGVIGGTNSCINNNTKVCILESAVFDLKSIRITSRRLGVRTDSSARYEKGVNVANSEIGIARALHLVSKLKCGKVVRGIIDIASVKNESKKVVGSIEKINEILGVEIPTEDMIRILNSLGIETKIQGKQLICIVPPFREDIENNNDLAEEIIRLYGYDIYEKINYKLFKNAANTEGTYHPRLYLERKFRYSLVEKGFYENISYSLVDSNMSAKLLLNDERKNLVRIANPISEDLSCLRSSLAHSLLTNVSYNLSVGNKDLKLFECGKIFYKNKDMNKELPIEQDMMGIVVYGENFDFFNLKGVVENLLIKTSCVYRLERSKEKFLHPGISADIFINDIKIGSFGKIHPLVLQNYNISGDVYYAELNTAILASLPEKKYIVNSISKYPIVERDLAVVVNEDVKVGDMIDSIKSACGKLFYEVKLFDIYRNSTIGENKKSLAFNIKLSDLTKTLTEEDIGLVIKKVLKSLNYKFGAVLR